MKKLLATAAILAAFIVPGRAELADGIAATLLYTKYCKSDLKPEVVLYAKTWQSKHLDDVQASYDGYLSRIKQMAPADWTLDEAMPIWCVFAKGALPEGLRQ
jgi:hypothetical protein